MLQHYRDTRKVLNIHSDGIDRVEGRIHMTEREIERGERETEREWVRVHMRERENGPDCT